MCTILAQLFQTTVLLMSVTMCFMKTTTGGKVHDEHIAALQILPDPHPVGFSVHHMADNPRINGSEASSAWTC